MKRKMLDLLAKAINHMAVKASGDASYYGFHQPKEPAALRATNAAAKHKKSGR